MWLRALYVDSFVKEEVRHAGVSDLVSKSKHVSALIAKAREAASLEHDRTMESLKRELGRLVVDTTAKVTGKVLTQEDQRRLQEEAAREVA